MAIKPRRLFRTSKYIIRDPVTGDLLDLRAPAACLRWPKGFRERLVNITQTDLILQNPGTVRQYANFLLLPIYEIHSVAVQLVAVQRTVPKGIAVDVYLRRNDSMAGLLVSPHEPVLRSILTYHFLTGEDLGELPPYHVARPVVCNVIEDGPVT